MEEIHVDILIIGGGGAGLRAALEAERTGARVVIVSKGVVGRSGLTQTAVTGYQAAFGFADARDNPGVHFEDTMRGGSHLSDPRLVRVFTEEAPQSVLDLETFGARFEHTADGKLVQKITDESQSYPRSVACGDSLGRLIMRTLRKESLSRTITRMDEVFVTRVLVADGRAVGAFAIDLKTGSPIVFHAKAVVLATGGAGALYSVHTNTPDSTGEGYALGYWAGADLVDMEFILFLGHAILAPESAKGTLFTFQRLYWHGAKPIFNAQGESFVPRYDPEGRVNPPREIYARAITSEVREGRGSTHGGAYFDPASIPMEVLLRELPSQTRYLMKFGFDMRTPVEIGVAAHYVCGGVRIDPNGQTSVPALFAVGEVSGGVHGAARIGGNSLAELLVFAKRVGRHAAKLAADGRAAPPPTEAIEAERSRISDMMTGRGRDGLPPSALKRQVQQIMWDHVGVIRNRAGLEEALDSLNGLEKEGLRGVKTSGPLQYNRKLMEALELEGMLCLGKMVARAALLREESRGTHFREDFPKMNAADWTRNIVLNRCSEEDGVAIHSTAA